MSATLNMLSADKLNGNYYSSLNNTVNTMLIINDMWFVLINECPQVLVADATRTDQEADECWVKGNEKVEHTSWQAYLKYS